MNLSLLENESMRIVGLALALALALGLTGCATTPMAASHAARVPPDRLLAFQEKTPEANATLVVTRDQGFQGGGCYYGFFINDILAARFDVAESATFYVKPDELVLRYGPDPQGRALCALPQIEGTPRETVMQDRQTKYFRLLIHPNGKQDIQRTDR